MHMYKYESWIGFEYSLMGPVTSKDMQTPPLLRSGYLYIEDAQYAETNEKSYLRFSNF